MEEETNKEQLFKQQCCNDYILMSITAYVLNTGKQGKNKSWGHCLVIGIVHNNTGVLSQIIQDEKGDLTVIMTVSMENVYGYISHDLISTSLNHIPEHIKKMISLLGGINIWYKTLEHTTQWQHLERAAVNLSPKAWLYQHGLLPRRFHRIGMGGKINLRWCLGPMDLFIGSPGSYYVRILFHTNNREIC